MRKAPEQKRKKERGGDAWTWSFQARTGPGKSGGKVSVEKSIDLYADEPL